MSRSLAPSLLLSGGVLLVNFSVSIEDIFLNPFSRKSPAVTSEMVECMARGSGWKVEGALLRSEPCYSPAM